jgi:16S rRNA (cytosine967-C5)-methyltransferase
MAKSEDNARRLAFEVLCKFERTGSERLKADALIQEALSSSAQALSDQDRGFTYALVMGTLRHWQRLDAWMMLLTKRKLKQLTPQVRVLLRLGMFQLYGLSHVPAYAALNTTVNLAKGLKQSPKTVGFINAVLREAQRRLEGDGFAVPSAEENLAQHLLWTYGWPEELTQKLKPHYTAADLLSMAQAAETPASGLSIRVNTLKTTPAAYQAQLKEAGWESTQPDETLAEGLCVKEVSGSPRQLPGYKEGWFYVQDPASMWVSRFLDPQPGERILDMCAAPGSKTTHMAALMNNQGAITALDPKPERLAMLQENLERLQISIVETEVADARDWQATAPENSTSTRYDRVLVDAPCSGSGTLRKHPEILLHLRKMDLSGFIQQQTALLSRAFKHLKPGGTMVYSTCSILPAENSKLIAQFLAKHPQAKLESEEQRLLNENADGFYAARIFKSI